VVHSKGKKKQWLNVNGSTPLGWGANYVCHMQVYPEVPEMTASTKNG